MLVTTQTHNTEVSILSYTHFTLEERKYLQKLLSEDYSLRKIAKILGRSPSSISREVKRNCSKHPKHGKSDNQYNYNHWRANTLYICRRRAQQCRALKPDTPQWDYIVEKMRKYWPPETICTCWKEKHPDEKPLCVSTIYRYIKLGKFEKITTKQHLRRRGKRIQSRNANYNSIQPDRIIPEWPQEIRDRIRVGDWEGDTVLGGIGKGLLVTLVDRKSRHLKMGLLKTKTAEETRLMIEKLLQGLPVKSISLDNGSEFSEFRKLEEHLHTLVYFAEPHKPWQRGTNENTNDIVRFFFPKGFDFRTVTDEDVQFVEDLINNRPRKCLGWKTPAEYLNESVALD